MPVLNKLVLLIASSTSARWVEWKPLAGPSPRPGTFFRAEYGERLANRFDRIPFHLLARRNAGVTCEGISMKNQTSIELSDILSGLADCGFTFIRVKPNDKRPDGKWSNLEDRITAEQAVTRISKGGNYGIVPPEGYFILDFDSDEAYRRSVAKDASIQGSLTFKTPRGYHVVFAGDGIAQGTSHTFLGQGVDIRAGNRGYVVGPGSSREDGKYEYLSGDEILDAPDSLRKLLQKPASRPTAEVFGTDTPPSRGTSPQSPVGASTDVPEGRRALTVMECGKTAAKHWKALDAATEGNRNDTISSAACGLGSLYGYADQKKRDEIFARIDGHCDRLASNPEELREFRTTARNQWEKGAESPASRPDGTEAEGMYRLVFAKFDIHEFEQALANLNIAIRDNQETDKVEIQITDDGSWAIPQGFRFKSGEWFIADKKTINTIIGNITRYFGRQRGENVVSVSLSDSKFGIWKDTIAGENPIRPWHEWLESPPAFIRYPGLELDNWLNPWLVNRDSELNRWISRAIPIGIVQKVERCPQACRVIPVLRGEKAIGKTTLVTELVPKPFRQMFGQFRVNSRPAEMVGAIHGKFLSEAGELAGMNDSRVSIFKAFIGNEVNTARLPYREDFQDYENTAFIIGTTNPERNVPNDDALRSRLAFMDLQKGPDPKEYLPPRLPQLYALAREAYLGGETVGVIPVHLEAEQFEASEESIIVNETMEDQILTADIRQLAKYFLLRDFMRTCGLVTRFAKRGPPGAERAVKNRLEELGVGIKPGDKVPHNGIRYYVMSDEMKRIRAQQIKEWGPAEPIYGYNIRKNSNDLSSLE